MMQSKPFPPSGPAVRSLGHTGARAPGTARRPLGGLVRSVRSPTVRCKAVPALMQNIDKVV
jgi:hypothetical protein